MLPEDDLDYLNSKGYTFNCVAHPGGIYLIIDQFTFPETYIPQIADLLIMIPPGYPNAPLDMFWTYPDVKLANGTWPTTSNHHEVHNGRNWQRWSRHGVWRPGIDTLQNFMRSTINEIAKGI